MYQLDDIQQQLAVSAQRHFERRAVVAADLSDATVRANHWREVAALGWLQAAVPDDLGGFGGVRELTILAREFALGLAQDPYLEAGVVPAVFAARAGLGDLFEAIVSGGSLVVAVYDIDGPTFADGRLSGQVGSVLGARDADRFLVPATQPDGARVVLLVDAAAAGLDHVRLSAIDGRPASILRFDRVAPDALFASAEAIAAWDEAIDSGVVGQCAEIMALAERMLDLSREHLQTRSQFGVTLDNFQALRHRLADIYADCEMARAMLSVGCSAFGLAPEQRARAVSACKMGIGQMVRRVGASAIQLHGAMAMTEEYLLGRYYKRSLVLRHLWGDEDFHAARMQALPREER